MEWETAYHATTENFENLQIREGVSSRHASSLEPAIWLTSRIEVAYIFISDYVKDLYPISRYGRQGAGVLSIGIGKIKKNARIIIVKVKLDNPIIVKSSEVEHLILGQKDEDWREAGELFAKFAKKVKESGYDGIIIKANPASPNLEFRAKQYVVFDEKKIKIIKVKQIN